MIDFALNHLPVFINVQRPSSACERVILSPLTSRAIVQWHSGSVSAHDCRKRDMVSLLVNRGGSLGQWVNRHCLQNHQTVTL
jgi:hypothetical protein